MAARPLLLAAIKIYRSSSLIADFHAHNGFDTSRPAMLYKIPGIIRGIDIGQRQRLHPFVNCRCTNSSVENVPYLKE